MSRLRTLGELMDALAACASQEEACELRDAYAEVNPSARENLGYCTGYFDHELGAELRRWMGTPHPIFGMGQPTPAEAFDAGVRRSRDAAS